MSQSVEVLFEKDIILFLILNWKKKPDIIFSYSLLEFTLRILIFPFMEKLADSEPEAIGHKSFILK